MVILAVEHGLIQLKIVDILATNPIVSFEAVAFWFKIFNKQMEEKTNIISIIRIKNKQNLIYLVSSKVILKH